MIVDQVAEARGATTSRIELSTGTSLIRPMHLLNRG